MARVVAVALLLLLGVATASASPTPRQPSPIPSPRTTAKAHAGEIEKYDRGSEQDKGHPTGTPTFHAEPKPTAFQKSGGQADYNSGDQIERELVSIERKIALFTALLVVAAGLQFLAAAAQVYTARLALRAERPYLLVAKAELKGFDDIPGENTEAQFTFKNFGKGPALIDRVLIRLNHVDRYPAKGDFSECKEKFPPLRAVAAGETLLITTDSKEGWSGVLDMDDIRNARRALICYGCVSYSDAIGRTHETAFLGAISRTPPSF